ncbi:MAG TPA: FecR family protein [Polyangiaceae bacterium]
MIHSDRTEPRRLAALSKLLRDAVKQPAATELEEGLETVRARLTRLSTSQPRRAIRLALLAAAALTVLVVGVQSVLFFWDGPRRSERRVAVDSIEGGELLEGGYLSERGHAGIRLFFNEGSRFVLEPGTRGRLRAITDEGTQLALEQGEASFRITHDPDHRWSVEAGPFSVVVRGTDFSVLWNSTREHFEVKLRSGSVAVRGPVVGDSLMLRPGQNLTVNLPKGEVVITEVRLRGSEAVASPSALPVASATPAPSPGVVHDSAESAPALPSARLAAPPRRQWRQAVANGQWDRILAEVDREGVGTILPTLSSDELFALADAARYRRRAELARTALLEQRRRFPGSPRSLDALFLLGRVEEARAGGKALAIRRYDEYLAQAPAGTYAAEALGRRMILTKGVEGPASASLIAAEYLRRFPKGSHVEAARALRQTP